MKNKKKIGLGVMSLLVIMFAVIACNKENSAPVGSSNQAVDHPGIFKSTGNGAPNGPHYDLNIIGVPHGKTADMSGNNGHRIFVNLSGNTKIYLKQGDFQVLDANGTDANGASFQLPNPDSANSGTTTYSVYARALGTPGGNAVIHLCALDASGNPFCSGDSVLAVRTHGHQTFDNMTKQLLYIFVDLNGDGTLDRVPLFDPLFQDYFWSYDNNGLKVLQLRFYQNPTTVQ